MKRKYTTEVILKAAEIGEVSMIDAKHIVSLLDEAYRIVNKNNIPLAKEFECEFDDEEDLIIDHSKLNRKWK
jgi:hypothetical protein